MCGIAGSFNKETLHELALKNTARGNRAHSLTIINPRTQKWTTYRSKTPYDGTILERMKPNYYGIIHVQAPTDVSSATHPALLEDYGLIHNGILKPHYMKKYDYQTTWDTEWLLNHMLARGIEYQHFTSILDKVDGAFSCVLLKQRQYIWLFRNSIAPMYRNELDISSAKIDGFEETKYDTVYRLDISEGYVFPIAHFKNIERPYVGV